MLTSKVLIEAIEEAGFTARSYSGRGMYGKACVGVHLDQGTDGFTLGFTLAARMACALTSSVDEGTECLEALAGLRVEPDSMGRGGIVYFPRMEWPSG